MAATRAQVEANKRYRRRSVRTLNVQFYPKDHDLFAYLDTVPSKAGFVKQLIREHMEQAIASGEYIPDTQCEA